jgi:hypothetical protein
MTSEPPVGVHVLPATRTLPSVAGIAATIARRCGPRARVAGNRHRGCWDVLPRGDAQRAAVLLLVHHACGAGEHVAGSSPGLLWSGDEFFRPLRALQLPRPNARRRVPLLRCRREREPAHGARRRCATHEPRGVACDRFVGRRLRGAGERLLGEGARRHERARRGRRCRCWGCPAGRSDVRGARSRNVRVRADAMRIRKDVLRSHGRRRVRRWCESEHRLRDVLRLVQTDDDPMHAVSDVRVPHEVRDGGHLLHRGGRERRDHEVPDGHVRRPVLRRAAGAARAARRDRDDTGYSSGFGPPFGLTVGGGLRNTRPAGVVPNQGEARPHCVHTRR